MQLQRDGRTPYTAVADSIGISEAQVRRIVKQLIARDVFTITAVADPRLMGLESMAWVALAVRVAHIERTAAALARMPEIDYVVITTGTWNVMAEVACPDGESLFGLLKHVRALPGVQRTETYQYFSLLRQQFQWTEATPSTEPAPFEPGVGSAPAEIDALDRMLIELLQDDGRASFRDIGQRLDVSERTASSRFTRLVKDGVVRVLAVGNPHELGFHGLAWLGIGLEADADADEAAASLARIPQVSYLVSAAGRYDLMAEIVCRDRAQLIATLDGRIGGIAGIETVETFYYLRLLYRNTAGAWSAARTQTDREGVEPHGVGVA